jgi:uncharacterized protein YqhQ
MNIGGQAVFEGVMMRGSSYWVVAVRDPSKKIILSEHQLGKWRQRLPIFKWPFVRGIFVLIETLGLGWKALSFSAEVAGEGELTRKDMFFALALALILVVALFVVLPTSLVFYAKGFSPFLKSSFLFSFFEGMVKVSIFLLYLVFIARLDEIKRVFQYHGAEHKTINAYEHSRLLTSEAARPFSRFHVSCGTSFILWVIFLMILIYSFIGTQSLIDRILWRILLLPLVAGLSYEIIKLARRFEQKRWVKILSFPGLLTQYLTTREPALDQLEVAMASLRRLLELEGVEVGA